MYELSNRLFVPKNVLHFLVVGYFSFFSSCNVINPDEKIPAYIHIDKIDLTTTYATQGSSSNKITDAWLFVDDKTIGVFELPATIPVLVTNGDHKINIQPGVKMNGISATRLGYAFYQICTTTADLKIGEKVTVNPVTSYHPTLSFDWKEDFEGFGISLIKGTASTDTVAKKTTNPADVFEGSGCAIIVLDGAKTYYEGVSSASFSIPQGSTTFLELNYRSNNSFIVGLYAGASTTPNPAISIKASESWNKIYINLSALVNTLNATSYTVFIAMPKEDGVSTAQLFLDNIKLIHS